MKKRAGGSANNRIRLYDGYRGEPIWKQPENNSTYYNYEVDKQCRVPIPSREDILASLEMT